METVEMLSQLYLIENDRINSEFDDAYYSICESLYDGVLTEAVSDNFGSSIKKFFANLITSIRNFINKFKNYMSKTAREASYVAVLNSMEKSIKKAKEEGKTRVTMLDYDYIRGEYKDMCKDLKSYAKRFTKMNYKSTLDIDKDLQEFDKVSNYWDKRMEKAIHKEKTISIDSALKFVENEKRGYSHVFDSLNDLIKDIEDMQHVAEETALRVNTLGSDIIPKHVNFLRRVANTISKKVTNFVSKTIAINVLLFA